MTGRCQATNKAGERCRAEGHLVGDDGLCANHRDPELASRAGKAGGAATGRAWEMEGLDPAELGPLESYADLKRHLSLIERAVLTGRISHRDAGVAIRGLQEWGRAHGDELTGQVVNKLKDRISELEAELKRSRVRAVK